MKERTSSAVPIICAGCGMEIAMPASYIIAKSGNYHTLCEMPDEPSTYRADPRVPKLYR